MHGYLFGFCDWYLIQIVLCYKISLRLIFVKQSTKPKFFNTENKPDYGSLTVVVVPYTQTQPLPEAVSTPAWMIQKNHSGSRIELSPLSCPVSRHTKERQNGTTCGRCIFRCSKRIKAERRPGVWRREQDALNGFSGTEAGI